VNPYVFIVGCPRSGTTLVRRVVDAHPDVAILHAETHWIPELFRARSGMREEVVTERLVPILLAHPKFAKLGFDADDLRRLASRRRARTYAEFVTALFDAYGAARGTRLVGDKTPGHAREIALLHRLWPQARFVHLIRDGRDVCLSALGWERKAADFERRFPTWREDRVTTAALWWRWHVESAREQRARLGPELYYELRYEDLVADPESRCRRLCDFLGIRFHDVMLRFHEGRRRAKPGLSAKHAWLPITPGLRNWKAELPGADIEAFEAVAGASLEECGYERAAPQPGSRAQARASRVISLVMGAL
jgi:sulfotransferase family protein